MVIKWKIPPRKRSVLAIIVFHTAQALEAEAKVPTLISSAKEVRGIEWQP